MEQAIKIAIENGWKENYPAQCSWCQYDHTFLDPLFWQALGKGLGKGMVCDDCATDYMTPRDNCMCGMSYPPLTVWWEFAWHRFVDHLASGKDINSFFKELTTLK